MVCGFIYGLVPVGDGCGSAFSPTVGGSQSRSVSDCSNLLGGRTDTAWELAIVGLATAVGSAVAARTPSTPTTRRDGTSL